MSTKAFTVRPILVVAVLIVVAFLALGFIVETYDQGHQLPTFVECSRSLLYLGYAEIFYAHDHDGNLPQDFDSMASYTKGDRPFNCPGSGAEYVLVLGRTSGMPATTILAYCPVPHRLYDPGIGGIGKELGMNILNLKPSVQSIKMDEVNELFTDQGVDLNTYDTTYNKSLQ